jgi:hypothetical protein
VRLGDGRVRDEGGEEGEAGGGNERDRDAVGIADDAAEDEPGWKAERDTATDEPHLRASRAAGRDVGGDGVGRREHGRTADAPDDPREDEPRRRCRRLHGDDVAERGERLDEQPADERSPRPDAVDERAGRRVRDDACEPVRAEDDADEEG